MDSVSVERRFNLCRAHTIPENPYSTVSVFVPSGDRTEKREERGKGKEEKKGKERKGGGLTV